MTNGTDGVDSVIGRRFANDSDGKRVGLQYMIRPGQIRDTGTIPLSASKHSGATYAGQPLWEDFQPRHESDGYSTSANTLWALRNRGVDNLFKGFNE
mgnify:FL=1